MAKPSFKVGLVQMAMSSSPDENVARAVEKVRGAAAKGAEVARIRAPRSTIDVGVSPTLCSGTGLPAIWFSLDLSTVGCTIVWVSDTSSRRSRFWNRTRLSAPSALRSSGPAHSRRRPAKPANVTFL